MSAMLWSRDALVEQQKRCAQRLARLSIPTASMPLPDGKKADAATVPCSQKYTTPASSAVAVPKQQAEERGWNGTLRTHLSVLQDEDPMCVLIVRRINRLGFESDAALKEYFTKFGSVRHVLVAHSRVKPNAKRPLARVRPAGIGFVVMASQEETNKVLSQEE